MKKHALLAFFLALPIAACQHQERDPKAHDRASDPRPVSPNPVLTPPGGETDEAKIATDPPPDREKPMGVVGAHPLTPPVSGKTPIPSPPPPQRYKSKSGPLACFAPMQKVPIPQWISRAQPVELNGDGQLDVILNYDRMTAKKSFVAVIEIILGDGKGGFKSVQAFDAGDMVLDTVVADFDEDGVSDIAAVDFRKAILTIYRGQGDGTVKPFHRLRTGKRAGELRSADFNRDGHADLLVTIENRAIQIFTGDGKGRLKLTATAKVEKAPERPVVEDLDNDGIVDIMLLNNDSHTAMSLLGKGDGSFKLAAKVSVCRSPTSLQAGQLDDDGSVDFAFACLGDPGIHILFNKAGGSQLVAKKLPAAPVEMVAIGDFTGDGEADIIATGDLRRGQLPSGYRLGSKVVLFEGDGRGDFSQRDWMLVPGHVGQPYVADVDQDGRLDIIASYWEGRRPGYVATWFGRSCKK